MIQERSLWLLQICTAVITRVITSCVKSTVLDLHWHVRTAYVQSASVFMQSLHTDGQPQFPCTCLQKHCQISKLWKVSCHCWTVLFRCLLFIYVCATFLGLVTYICWMGSCSTWEIEIVLVVCIWLHLKWLLYKPVLAPCSLINVKFLCKMCT